MAKVMKSQGGYLVSQGGQYLLVSLTCLLLGGLVALVFHPLLGLIAIPLATYFLDRYARYRKGWTGEQEVIQALLSLDNSYYIVHDAPLSGANIDHIVLGPNGIFVLETKHFSGRVTCEGDRWWINQREISSPSLQAKCNAARARSQISSFEQTLLKEFPPAPWVHAVVVLSNSQAKIMLHSPTVIVARVGDLVQKITATPSVRLPSAALTKMGLALMGMREE